MKTSRLKFLALAVWIGNVIAVLPTVTGACPICSGCCSSPTTLADQIADSNFILLADRVSGDEQMKQTTFVIRHVERDEFEELRVGDSVSIPYFSKIEPSGSQLILGSKNQAGELNWQCVGEVTEARLNYILEAPAANVAATRRLPYFVQFLESADSLIADDAFLELDFAEWKDLLACSQQLPRNTLREWLRDPKTQPKRAGLYAMLLGICGDKSDAEFLLAHIRQPTNDFRLGIERYEIAYLWRTGEPGLKVLDDLKLRPKNVVFSERYAVMQAIRFVMGQGSERISRERACESVRLLLAEPEFADLVIADLQRWEDWSVQNRLMSLYGQGEYNLPPIKRAIARYLLAAGKITTPISGNPDKLGTEIPESEQLPHVLQARSCLERLCKQDIKTVQQAERLFFLK
ncbi:MAG: hypothetical protein NT013_03305 [Planctomycetia bacterium]|nr:hypothetical protein [Planctomycetia bacterium]